MLAHILVIEDDPQLREFLRRMMERAGHEVTEAVDGWQGVKAQRTRPADLVVCDLFMPNMDGFEVIRLLRQEFPAIKIIAVSGGGFGGRMNLLPIAKHLGVVAVLHKPFTTKVMVAAVEQALRAPTA